ncbi:hypothetical protein H6G81_21750 [Scytonema hofmannii FACHB-248]|uniref:Uncharacterized protein n=1 Tax=Scytonema hofmannii FACHB-248 TaxID=1842502 RepID=A0ABR8GUD0_9CYAN|nr:MULTISPECIES: hypothetical protein [Nostocales]MBD2607080.1 hypothetical protein [Scytonema hofmannii FACHB-248]
MTVIVGKWMIEAGILSDRKVELLQDLRNKEEIQQISLLRKYIYKIQNPVET